MLKSLLSFSLIFLGCIVSATCSPKTETEAVKEVVLPVGAPESGFGPAIWKTGDSDTIIYLFGTVHVLPPELEWKTDAFEKVFDESDTVYFEADVSGADSSLAMAVAKLGFLSNGQTLFGLLADKEKKKLETVLNELKIPHASIDRMQPWFAAMMIAMQSIQQLGQDPESGVESVLEPQARASGKSLRYFETPEEQLGFMAGLDPDLQIEILMETVNQVELMEQSILEMDLAWVKGNIEDLERLVMSDPSMASDELKDVMLTKRNQNWADALEQLTNEETGTFFVAVGAAHLIGETSVQSLLDEKGIGSARIQ